LDVIDEIKHGLDVQTASLPQYFNFNIRQSFNSFQKEKKKKSRLFHNDATPTRNRELVRCRMRHTGELVGDNIVASCSGVRMDKEYSRNMAAAVADRRRHIQYYSRAPNRSCLSLSEDDKLKLLINQNANRWAINIIERFVLAWSDLTKIEEHGRDPGQRHLWPVRTPEFHGQSAVGLSLFVATCCCFRSATMAAGPAYDVRAAELREQAANDPKFPIAYGSEEAQVFLAISHVSNQPMHGTCYINSGRRI
jgi:hypothetical protein